jgi:hypothetical protein
MRKPVPEDFGLTIEDYKQAIAQLSHILAQKKRTKSIITLVTFIISPLVATGVAIGVAKLTIWFLVNEFGVKRDDTMGHVVLVGFVAWCFAAAAVSGMLDKYSDRKWSKQLSNPVYHKVRLYEESLERYEHTSKQYWISLRGQGFEKQMAQLYKRLGYSVKQTQASVDEGIDLILWKDGKNIIVQCKGHEKPIGVGAVRDLYGTMMHSGAERAVLACPAGFTNGVRKFADGKPIDLLTAKELVEMAERVHNDKNKE